MVIIMSVSCVKWYSAFQILIDSAGTGSSIVTVLWWPVSQTPKKAKPVRWYNLSYYKNIYDFCI